MKKAQSFAAALAVMMCSVPAYTYPVYAAPSAYTAESGTAVDFHVIVNANDGELTMRKGPGAEYEKAAQEPMHNGDRLHITKIAVAASGNPWGYTMGGPSRDIPCWVALIPTSRVEEPGMPASPAPVSAPAPAAVPAPSAAVVSGYDVAVIDGVNIRSGAGVEYDKLQNDLIPGGIVLHVTKEAVASNGNKWGYVSYNGKEGWVALLQTRAHQTQTAVPVPAPVTTAEGSSYDVQVIDGVNIRSGAGVEYDKLQNDLIPGGVVLHVTKEAVASNGNKWGYVSYNGKEGWVALLQTRPHRTDSPAPVKKTENTQKKAPVTEKSTTSEQTSGTEKVSSGKTAVTKEKKENSTAKVSTATTASASGAVSAESAATSSTSGTASAAETAASANTAVITDSAASAVSAEKTAPSESAASAETAATAGTAASDSSAETEEASSVKEGIVVERIGEPAQEAAKEEERSSSLSGILYVGSRAVMGIGIIAALLYLYHRLQRR